MIKLIFTLALAVNLVGCKPAEIIPEPISSKLPIVWKIELERTGLSSTPHYFEDKIIFGHPSSVPNTYVVYALNLATGAKTWQTKIVTPFEFDPFSTEGTYLYENKLILANPKRLFVLNTVNGEILWQYEDANNYKGICVIDGYIYIADMVNRSSSTMYRFDINTGSKESLFSLKYGKSEPGGDFTPSLLMPVKWVHPSGDEILVLQNPSYGYDKIGPDGMYGYSKMDLMAYNLTSDSILWYRYELDNFSSSARPAIDGNKVYFYGDHHAYCINPLNGETIWKYFIGDGPEDDFNTANILIVDDKLIVKPDNDHIHGVNKETGKRIWLNENTEAMPGLLTVHNDTIWFASSGVFGINAKTGIKLIDDWNNDNGSWIFPVTHHPTNGKIYTSDGKNFYCLNPKFMK